MPPPQTLTMFWFPSFNNCNHARYRSGATLEHAVHNHIYEAWSTCTHVVRNESAEIQFEPPQKIRMLFISKSQVSPGWSTNLSSTTFTRRNPTFCFLLSSNWLCYTNGLSKRILHYQQKTYIIIDPDLDLIQRLFTISDRIP